MLKQLEKVGDEIKDSGTFKVVEVLREMDISPKLAKTAIKVYQDGKYYFIDLLFAPSQRKRYYLMEGEEYTLTTDGKFDAAKISKTEFKKNDGKVVESITAAFMNLVPKTPSSGISTIDITRKLDRYGAHFGYTPTVQDKVILSALMNARIVGDKSQADPRDIPSYDGGRMKGKPAIEEYGDDIPF